MERCEGYPTPANAKPPRGLESGGDPQGAARNDLFGGRRAGWPAILLSFLADQCPLAQFPPGTSECLAAREHGLEEVAVLFDPLEHLAHAEAARRHVLC